MFSFRTCLLCSTKSKSGLLLIRLLPIWPKSFPTNLKSISVLWIIKVGWKIIVDFRNEASRKLIELKSPNLNTKLFENRQLLPSVSLNVLFFGFLPFNPKKQNLHVNISHVDPRNGLFAARSYFLTPNKSRTVLPEPVFNSEGFLVDYVLKGKQLFGAIETQG